MLFSKAVAALSFGALVYAQPKIYTSVHATSTISALGQAPPLATYYTYYIVQGTSTLPLSSSVDHPITVAPTATRIYTSVHAISTISSKGQAAPLGTLSTYYIVQGTATLSLAYSYTGPPLPTTTGDVPPVATGPVPTTTPTAVAPTGPLAAPSDYPSTGTYQHNIHRLNHSAPVLTWNTQQAAYAAQVASTCVFQHDTTLGGGGYGQNIASYGSTGNVAGFSPANMLAIAITNQWYNGEFSLYLPSYYGSATTPPNFSAWGHFSQVVWKGSSSVGCGSQFCPAGTIFPTFDSWFTVCNYVAPGNYANQFGANVGVPLGQPVVMV